MSDEWGWIALLYIIGHSLAVGAIAAVLAFSWIGLRTLFSLWMNK